MDEVERTAAIAEWRRALSDADVAVPTDVVVLLGAVIDHFVRALREEPFDAGDGERIGRSIAVVGPADTRALRIAAQQLCRLSRHSDHPEATVRMAALLATAGCGFQRHLDEGGRGAGETGGAAEAELFRSVLDRASVGVGIGDLSGTLIYGNPWLATMTGIPVEDLAGANLHGLADPEDRRTIDAAVFGELVAARSGTVRFEAKAVAPEGDARWAAFSISYIRGGPGHPDHLLGLGEDTTERHLLQEELYRQARHDALTGLSNRRHLLERIREVADTPSAHGTTIGLCFADLDGFKTVNDTHGHRFGDDVLRAVSDRLRAILPGDGLTIARLGGDEFVILVPAPADDTVLQALTEALRTALVEPLEVGGRRITVSASVGVVLADAAAASAEELLDAADRQLYRAKRETWNARR